MFTPTLPQRLLVDEIAGHQDHVLSSVEGLAGAALTRAVAPSGWSLVALLGHLTFDDEIFWIHAILAGEQAAIDAIRDGWQESPADPLLAITRYREACLHTRELLSTTDLDAAPRWWPPAEVFPFPAFASGWQCALRLASETATHAGHLDLCRERLDGHQHLVVSPS